MGGLGPGIGGFELVVIGIVALLVVGPKDLPLLMRRVGQIVAKARGMANDFRASFDEMARQSELDELRKEVESLRKGQGMFPLGDEAAAAFKDINSELTKPLDAPTAAAADPEAVIANSEPAAAEWPEPTRLTSVDTEVKNAEVSTPAIAPAAKPVKKPAKAPAKKAAKPKAAANPSAVVKAEPKPKAAKTAVKSKPKAKKAAE